MDDFLCKVKEQLKCMSEEEKDSWILSQARTTPQCWEEDFYKSICGKKRIIYMPEKQDIHSFCEQVENGKITVQYETHYVEFDDFGHFHDDWEHTFHDPSDAMSFLETVFRGCHDLVLLEDYILSYEILDEILRLKFEIEDHPDTDDSCSDEFFDLHCAVREGMLYVDCVQILQDYVKSCKACLSDKRLARKLVDAFEMELFKDVLPTSCLEVEDPLLFSLRAELAADIAAAEEALTAELKINQYSVNQYAIESNIKNISRIIKNLDEYARIKEAEPPSFLKGAWAQISKLLETLSYQPYIDAQLEIDEIWKIAQALVKRGKFDEEPWEIKRQILIQIYGNDLYNEYGCDEPMNDLAKAMCTTEEENLRRAAIMEKEGDKWIGKMAAKLYHELGNEEKYVDFYEKHLAKEKEAYEIVMNYYKDNNHEKALEIAELALEKCKDDQTPFIIFLMEEAKKNGDEALFLKLNRSVHMRRAVDSGKVDEYFLQ